MMEFQFVDALGFIGLVEVLYAYAMLSMKRWNSDTLSYQLLNISGSIFLAIDAYGHAAAPIFILNVVWTLIGVVALVRILRKRNSKE